MILRKDYVRLIRDGKAQVEVEKTEITSDQQMAFAMALGISNPTPSPQEDK